MSLIEVLKPLAPAVQDLNKIKLKAINEIIYEELEPGVINDEMLKGIIREQYTGEAKRLANMEEINYENITILRLEFQNILKIDHLWVLPNLLKLSLKCNNIEKIENLDTLVKLIELDLSFNRIEFIENLNNLINLEILSLFNNQIKILENLDSLENLLILSVGNNKLETYNGIERFRFMKKLYSLNMEGNPISENSMKFRTYIAAFLPNLKYYNYKYIDDVERENGSEKYRIELRQLEETQVAEIKERKRIAKEQDDERRLSSSFVELLNEHQLFTSLYEGDIDGDKLLLIGEDAETLIIDYREEVFQLTQQIYKLGLQQHERRLNEINMFKKCVNDARKKAQKIGINIIDDFMIKRDNNFQLTRDVLTKIEKELTTIIDEPTKKFNDLSEEYEQFRNDFYVLIDETWQILMESEIQLTERIEEANVQFGHIIKDMLNEFIEESQSLFVQIRTAESNYSDGLLEAVSTYITVKAASGDAIPDELKEGLEDKDVIANFIAGSRDYHMQKIDSREDKLTTRGRNWVQDLVADIQLDETNRNRAKVTEIHYFLDKQREAFENLQEEVHEENKQE